MWNAFPFWKVLPLCGLMCPLYTPSQVKVMQIILKTRQNKTKTQLRSFWPSGVKRFALGRQLWRMEGLRCLPWLLGCIFVFFPWCSLFLSTLAQLSISLLSFWYRLSWLLVHSYWGAACSISYTVYLFMSCSFTLATYTLYAIYTESDWRSGCDLIFVCIPYM